MRPDVEDFDELNMPESSPRSRAMAWLVLMVTVVGFTSLAFYAYKSGTQSMRDNSLTVVEADDSPIKSAPVDAQGEQFLNKDKTIYDAIAEDRKSAQHVEKLLPDAERPTLPELSEDDAPMAATPPAAKPKATTYVNAVDTGEAAEAKPPAEKPADSIPPLSEPVRPVVAAAKPAQPIVLPEDTSPPKAVVAVDTSADPEEEEAPAQPTPAAPEMVNVKPVTVATKPTSEEKDAKAQAKPTPVKVVKASGGAYKIQLGAFKSEDEAMAQWKKISTKNSDVLGGAPIIVKADTPKGTFYRLRTSVADAKAACAKLAARKQACFPVGK